MVINMSNKKISKGSKKLKRPKYRYKARELFFSKINIAKEEESILVFNTAYNMGWKDGMKVERESIMKKDIME